MSNSYTAILQQAIELIESLDEDQYQKKIPPHFPSSIGIHMRHVVDHFQALRSGLESKHVDYNVRHRFSDMEEIPENAVDALKELSTWLLDISDELLEMPLTINSEMTVAHSKSNTCQSTLERELVFVSSHAVHHFALVKIICAMQNKECPEYFGFAPATIKHIRSA